MRAVSVKAVLIGGVVDVASSLALAIPFAICEAMYRHFASSVNRANPGPASTNPLLHLAGVFVDSCCSVFGGYIAARLAKHHELLNGALSAYLCTMLGTILLATRMDHHPIYIQILLIASGPLLALIGGYLRLRQTRALPTC